MATFFACSRFLSKEVVNGKGRKEHCINCNILLQKMVERLGICAIALEIPNWTLRCKLWIYVEQEKVKKERKNIYTCSFKMNRLNKSNHLWRRHPYLTRYEQAISHLFDEGCTYTATKFEI